MDTTGAFEVFREFTDDSDLAELVFLKAERELDLIHYSYNEFKEWCSKEFNRIYTNDKNIRLLEEYATYEDNWNKYGAPKFDRAVLGAAKVICDILRDNPPKVFATASSAIQLEWTFPKGLHAEITIEPDEKNIVNYFQFWEVPNPKGINEIETTCQLDSIKEIIHFVEWAENYDRSR